MISLQFTYCNDSFWKPWGWSIFIFRATAEIFTCHYKIGNIKLNAIIVKSWSIKIFQDARVLKVLIHLEWLSSLQHYQCDQELFLQCHVRNLRCMCSLKETEHLPAITVTRGLSSYFSCILLFIKMLSSCLKD